VQRKQLELHAIAQDLAGEFPSTTRADFVLVFFVLHVRVLSGHQ
jgi:hypothetical protein